MLPKSRRIPRKMLSSLFKGSRIYRNDVFLLKLVSASGQNSRFGFSISKKIAKNAVVRNKWRRTGYRLIKDYMGDIDKGIIALFSFTKLPQDADEAALKLKDILKKSKLI